MSGLRAIIRTVRNDRGDTLVEVTIALAILASVLTAAYVVSNRAYILGQQSRERSELVNEAQQQAEALKVFRDTHRWFEFENGGTLSGIYYPGIKTRFSSGDCDPGTPGNQTCFHIERRTFGASSQWVPIVGPGNTAVFSTKITGTYFSINASPNNLGGCSPGPICRDSYDFDIGYGSDAAGKSIGPAGAGTQGAHLTIKLQNLEPLQQ